MPIATAENSIRKEWSRPFDQGSEVMHTGLSRHLEQEVLLSKGQFQDLYMARCLKVSQNGNWGSISLKCSHAAVVRRSTEERRHTAPHLHIRRQSSRNYDQFLTHEKIQHADIVVGYLYSPLRCHLSSTKMAFLRCTELNLSPTQGFPSAQLYLDLIHSM